MHQNDINHHSDHYGIFYIKNTPDSLANFTPEEALQFLDTTSLAIDTLQFTLKTDSLTIVYEPYQHYQKEIYPDGTEVSKSVLKGHNSSYRIRSANGYILHESRTDKNGNYYCRDFDYDRKYNYDESYDSRNGKRIAYEYSNNNWTKSYEWMKDLFTYGEVDTINGLAIRTYHTIQYGDTIKFRQEYENNFYEADCKTGGYRIVKRVRSKNYYYEENVSPNAYLKYVTLGFDSVYRRQLLPDGAYSTTVTTPLGKTTTLVRNDSLLKKEVVVSEHPANSNSKRKVTVTTLPQADDSLALKVDTYHPKYGNLLLETRWYTHDQVKLDSVHLNHTPTGKPVYRMVKRYTRNFSPQKTIQWKNGKRTVTKHYFPLKNTFAYLKRKIFRKRYVIDNAYSRPYMPVVRELEHLPALEINERYDPLSQLLMAWETPEERLSFADISKSLLQGVSILSGDLGTITWIYHPDTTLLQMNGQNITQDALLRFFNEKAFFIQHKAELLHTVQFLCNARLTKGKDIYFLGMSPYDDWEWKTAEEKRYENRLTWHISKNQLTH
ncbi:MAG: hypothetical protein CL843_18275 [Crocinitomicaceae bacterium]|nr:hypothetical protein [Crocinitomicaceae bacterium]